MPSRFVRLAALVATLAAAGIAAAAPAQPPAQAPAPARLAPLKFVARYDLSITVDANRPSEAVSRVKAAKGAMALLGGSIAAGTIEDVVNIGDEAYTISSTGKADRILATLLGGDTLTRRSEGAVGGGYMASQRFSESRGTKRRLGVNTDYPKRIAIFYKNGKESKVETVNYRIADSASMPYLFLRQPLPLTAMTIAATDGIAIREFIMKVSDEVVQVGKAQVAAVHLTRDQRKGDDASLDLWVRKEDGMPLRFRVGLDDKYGVVLEQKLRELPPVLK